MMITTLLINILTPPLYKPRKLQRMIVNDPPMISSPFTLNNDAVNNLSSIGLSQLSVIADFK